MLEVDIVVDHGRKFRLIANPLHSSCSDRPSTRVLTAQSYDIWDVNMLFRANQNEIPQPIPSGRYLLSVKEMQYQGREAVLKLRLRHKPHSRSQGPRRSRRILDKTEMDDVWSLQFDVPLSSNGSSNLVELDIDQIQGRCWSSVAASPAGAVPPAIVIDSSSDDDRDERPRKFQRIDGIYNDGGQWY